MWDNKYLLLSAASFGGNLSQQQIVSLPLKEYTAIYLFYLFILLPMNICVVLALGKLS